MQTKVASLAECKCGALFIAGGNYASETAPKVRNMLISHFGQVANSERHEVVRFEGARLIKGGGVVELMDPRSVYGNVRDFVF